MPNARCPLLRHVVTTASATATAASIAASTIITVKLTALYYYMPL
jgi:hypothetical protein